MKTRQIHGLGLGEFLIFAPAKEMLKSAYFFSALRQGGFLVVDKERCYFFMMRVVAMPLAVATRTTYTPGARPSTLA